MTPRETILQALFARLQTIPDARVLRNEVLPEVIPSGGLIILRDGETGDRIIKDSVFSDVGEAEEKSEPLALTGTGG